MLREVLERRIAGFNYRSFVIIELQALILLMVLALFSRLLAGFAFFAAAELLLFAAYIYVLLFQLREEVKADREKYLLFFSVLAAFIQLAWIIPLFTGSFQHSYLLFAGIMIALTLFMLLFSLLFGRNYTLGRVLLSNERLAVVETEFDILAFTNAGRYIVETAGRRKEGELVRVETKRFIFSRRPHRIIKIIVNQRNI